VRAGRGSFRRVLAPGKYSIELRPDAPGAVPRTFRVRIRGG
jgi:hypothetical protein